MDINADTGSTPVADPARRTSLATRLAVMVGSIGLLGAMATDALAVLGRHTGFSVLGSIEIVQTMIVLLASSAIVLATLERNHAAVHILTERLAPPTAARLARAANVASAVIVAVLLIGALWLMFDLWGAHERSELLHIPFRVLRAIFAAALLIVALVFARQAIGARTR
ncbi:TRAP transporter small permease [Sphingomonas endolithica]|uniref:TRAP transporter small permease n=1 Tax=Sphingomonas endolithica TaxID=2972485 RepID=UPI0021B02BA7|nr:TRAP transporter small permease [Sphingomonas sp. ZFBP2030]